ncbi:hypothetical protein ACN28S_64885 [Cystobacter fuscus]
MNFRRIFVAVVGLGAVLTVGCGAPEVSESEVTASRTPGVYVDNGEATFVAPSVGLEPGHVRAMVVCVPVSCDGQPAGQACGNTTGEIIDDAIRICG